MPKSENYELVLKQIKALIEDEKDLIANLSNVSSALHYTFNFHWTGFYIVKNNELVLGPFQGPVACTRIGFDKGVCGTAWKNKKPIRVDNVHLFEKHIACSALSNSEIVLPLMKNEEVWGVLDIDSTEFDAFEPVDEEYLLQIVSEVNKLL
ncbi:MAG: GAF domain-containing protein [Flavobacteriales bacterium]|nr:GAF domain-containing protein [Flavobacteriales bacterium]